jgi:RecB family exonuclease
MRERIYLAPGANGGELIKSLAMHGFNCFNLRIMGAGDLARMAMMRSGIAIPENFIDAREETALINHAMAREKYFIRPTYADVKKITTSIRQMRCLVSGDNETEQIETAMKKGIFTEKNAAVIQVYKNYMNLLSDKKCVDLVSLLRRAASECKAIDADFFILKEYPVTPLERSLLDRLSGCNYKEVSVLDLFEQKSNDVRIASFKNCYGAPNEVETILNDIYSGKKLDQCVVAVTDPGIYGQLFFDYALLYDIPITFGCGIPIINSNPARLLTVYHEWMTSGFYGDQALERLLSSDAFDKGALKKLYPEPDENFSDRVYHDVIDNLRLTNEEKINNKRISDFIQAITEEEAITDPNDEKALKLLNQKKLCIPYLEILAKELALLPEDFIVKYSYIRRGAETNSQRLLMMLDMAASKAIYDELKIIRESGVEQATEDMILNVLQLAVADGRSEEGKLHVATIDGAISSIRDNLYIAGLSASNYPGSRKENYLLLDDDIECFEQDAEFMTSDGKIKNKCEKLIALAQLYTGLNSNINVSYSGLNVSELKKDNASSLVYELYSLEKGENVSSDELNRHVQKVAYFEPAISVTRKVGEAYNEGKKILGNPETKKTDEFTVKIDQEMGFAPSILEEFYKCPRAYMLKRVLGIPEPVEDKPFETIAADEIGTLAHALLERLANSDMSIDEFKKLAGEYFDRFLLEHPPLVSQNAMAEKAQFIDMMETAYEMDPHREVVLKEEDISCEHDSGVKLHGYPDRVEKLDDGSYLIVDFKSGREVSHVQDDIDTCLQVVIYAYLMEKQGNSVAGGEYRYIRLGETVSCKYDEEMKTLLDQKLKIFKEAMDSYEFPLSTLAINRSEDDPDPCKYCKYGMICGKEAEIGGLGDE